MVEIFTFLFIIVLLLILFFILKIKEDKIRNEHFLREEAKKNALLDIAESVRTIAANKE